MSSYRGGSGGGAPKVRKVMTQAINLMFEFLKNVRFYSLLVFSSQFELYSHLFWFSIEGESSNLAFRKYVHENRRHYHCKLKKWINVIFPFVIWLNVSIAATIRDLMNIWT